MKLFRFIVLMVFCFTGSARAQQPELYKYEPITVENLSQFYWTINKMDMSNDQQIDNFMRINECDIYNDYHHNEFEWKQVRDSGRKYIEQNKPEFPTRFEFMQPLRLTEYDLKTGIFGIVPNYQIEGVRRFEAYAENSHDTICGVENEISNYERGLMVEVNRPVMLTEIKVDPKIAEQYIVNKTEKFKKLENQSKEALYETRDAYVVLKFHGYSYIGPYSTVQGMKMASILATLEGVEVYGDKDRKLLLYSENFIRKREVSDMEKKLIEEYEATKKKAASSAAP